MKTVLIIYGALYLLATLAFMSRHLLVRFVARIDRRFNFNLLDGVNIQKISADFDKALSSPVQALIYFAYTLYAFPIIGIIILLLPVIILLAITFL